MEKVLRMHIAHPVAPNEGKKSIRRETLGAKRWDGWNRMGSWPSSLPPSPLPLCRTLLRMSFFPSSTRCRHCHRQVIPPLSIHIARCGRLPVSEIERHVRRPLKPFPSLLSSPPFTQPVARSRMHSGFSNGHIQSCIPHHRCLERSHLMHDARTCHSTWLGWAVPDVS
ncbi:hypothetical protein IE53DRAFT_64125 [Violaceomyces palustris]|uniref:Uncharacterized protein n=1 Tax=Violaceomyces palustris TaxID=1673888 RepID=A0ACD0NZB1_9BASI|nr:hypothetical protein IE53DRAFT_64125 [Violaceomyces palustris]